MNTLRNPASVLRSGLAGLLGGGTGAVFGLLLAVVVGRGLGPEGSGFFFQMVALFMILANVLELGADTGLVRQLSRQVSLRRFGDLRRTVMVALTPVVAIGTVVTVAVWLFAPSLAAILSAGQGSATVASLIAATAPFVLAASLLTVLLAGSRGLGRILPFVGLFNVTLPATRVLTVLLVLSAGAGVLGAARAWAWPLIVLCAAAAVLLARHLSTAVRQSGAERDEPRPTSELAREFWAFSGPRGVAAGLEIGLAWADVLIVAAVLGPASGGVYAVASRAARAGLLVETAVRMVVSPSISASIAAENPSEVRNLHAVATQWMILLAWPLYISLALFAPLILDVFGADFDTGAAGLVVLCCAMMLLCAAGVVQSVLLMGGHSRAQMGNKAVALGINIGGNLALLPVLGIVAAGLSWIITVIVDSALAVWQVHRCMHVRLALARIVRLGGLVLGVFAVPGLLVRGVLGATPTSLVVHLLVSSTVLAAAAWLGRHRLGLTRLVERPDPDSRPTVGFR